MKKHLIVVALVLLIAMGVVFAEDTNPPSPALASLYGKIAADLFDHGFTKDDVKYLSGIDIMNAFISPYPVIEYGFDAKFPTTFRSMLSVEPFVIVGSSDIIPIADVLIDGSTKTAVNDQYEVLAYTEADVRQTDSVEIVIVPDLSEDPKAGTYVSEITVTIETP
jgi:hypothetical protein